MSQGEIEGLIFKRLRNDIDEREGTGIIRKSITRKEHFSKICSLASPEVENITDKETLV